MATAQLNSLASAIAALINLLVKIQNGNYLAFFEITSVLLDLKGFDFAKLKAEILVLSDADKTALEQLFLSQISVSDAALKERIVGLVGALDNSIAIIEEEFQCFYGIESVIAKFKVLLGV